MAIQFPNFLSSQIVKPDYSGFADIVSNYYAGKQMPKDDLIKAVQAEFARPTAEQSLTHSKLANQQLRQSISKAATEMREQAQLQALLKQALSGGGGSPPQQMPATNQNTIGTQVGTQQPPQGANINPKLGEALQANQFDTKLSEPEEKQFQVWKQRYAPNDSGADYDLRGAFKAGLTPDPKTGHWPDTYKKPNHPTFSNQSIYASQAPNKAGTWNGDQYVPPQQAAPQTEAPNEQVLDKGLPHLYGVDQMWDNNPISQEFLKKKGFSKEVKREKDKKTGIETIYTKYPSGRMTKTEIVPEVKKEDLDKGIPLTTQVLNKTVSQVKGTDAIIPYIDELIDMGEKGQLPHTYWAPTNAHATYIRTATEALDKYLTAAGLNQTDMSAQSIKEILFRSFNESTDHYINELKKLKARKIKERQDNIEIINKGIKKFGDFGSSSPGSDMSDEELEKIANG